MATFHPTFDENPLRIFDPGSVYATWKGGLGDLWAATSLFHKLSEYSGQSTKISSPDTRIKRIAALMNTSGSVESVDRQPDVLIFSEDRRAFVPDDYPFRNVARVIPWRTVFRYRYCSAKTTAKKPEARTVISYQLTTANRPISKSSPENHISLFCATLQKMGFDVTKVGQPRTLDESLYEICRASLFVGICSGMSHLAHSTLTPVVLIRNSQPSDLLIEHHSAHGFSYYDSVPHFLANPELLRFGD